MYILSWITAISSLIGSLSIFAGYWLYRARKRDEVIQKVRAALQFCWRTIAELDLAIDGELILEILNYITADDITMQIMGKVYDELVVPLAAKTTISKGQIYKYIEDNEDKIKELAKPLFIPIKTSETQRIAALLDNLQSRAIEFLPDCKELCVLYRICSMNSLITLNRYKKALRESDYWKTIYQESIAQVLSNGVSRRTLADFEYEIMRACLHVAQGYLEEEQKDIDTFAMLSETVNDACMRLSDIGFSKFINRKNSEFEEQETTSKVLLMVKESFKGIFTDTEEQKFHDEIIAFRTRQEQKQNKQS